MKKILLFSVLLVLFSRSLLYAGPAAPDPIEITQPDGTTFKAIMQGDERWHWVESVVSGHTIIHNKATGYWEYAEKRPDGTLKGSGIRVDSCGKNAPDSIPKGIRPDRTINTPLKPITTK